MNAVLAMSIRFIESATSPPLPLRLRGIGIDHLQEAIRRSHGFPHYQWLQVCSGTASVQTINGSYRAYPGDGFFLRPNEYHAYHSALDDEALVLNWVCFDGDGMGQAMESAGIEQSAVYRLARPKLILDWFAVAWEASNKAGLPPWRILSAKVYELFMILGEALGPPGESGAGKDIQRLMPLTGLLETRLADGWTVPSMAAFLEMSPQHLGRLFKRSLGRSPLDYLVQLRINRAQSLLVERPQLPIHEIADAVGYRDVNLFIRRFRERSGCTPGAFRRLHR